MSDKVPRSNFVKTRGYSPRVRKMTQPVTESWLVEELRTAVPVSSIDLRKFAPVTVPTGDRFFLASCISMYNGRRAGPVIYKIGFLEDRLGIYYTVYRPSENVDVWKTEEDYKDFCQRTYFDKYLHKK